MCELILKYPINVSPVAAVVVVDKLVGNRLPRPLNDLVVNLAGRVERQVEVDFEREVLVLEARSEGKKVLGRAVREYGEPLGEHLMGTLVAPASVV